MKFIVDECTGSRVAKWLRGEGHDVFSVYDEARGLSDDGVIKIAWDEQRILVTNDKDFGEKVFRDRRPHVGVILMRLEDERSAVKIHVLSPLLEIHGSKLSSCFTVVTEDRVKFSPRN